MKPLPNTLVFQYNDAIIQLGFIAFFAVSMPFVAMFSFMTNLISISIKLQVMEKYGRRQIALSSSDIGNWKSIMSFLSFFAIPINLSILLFARDPGPEERGFDQDHDEIEPEEQSAMQKWFMNQDSFWTRTNIILLAILVEHLIIGLKIVIGILIPDVPKDVKESELKRKIHQQSAQQQIDKTVKELNDLAEKEEKEKGRKQAGKMDERQASPRQENEETEKKSTLTAKMF